VTPNFCKQIAATGFSDSGVCVSVQMGCVTIDGVMYSMRPYVRGALSRMPYPPAVEDINYGSDTYRLIPVELRLNFDDERHRPSRTSQFYYAGCRINTTSY